jgi:CRP/FNR family cyclic AMP-dependent transcriptional regulator
MTNLGGAVDISEARRVLSMQGWLTQTPPPFREAVLLNSELHHFTQGETIYAQGDDSVGLWGLADGTVGVEFSGRQSSPSFVYFAHKGFWIGAHSLVLRSDRQLGLMAMKPCSLLHLTNTAFQGIAREMPEAWRWLSVLPLLQNAVAFGTLEDLMIRDSRRRCAAILLRLAGCRGPLESAEPNEIFITQEHLAEMINLSRTALGEVLRNFEAKGFISRQYGRMTIERHRLEEVANLR